MCHGNKLVLYTCMTAEGVCGIHSGTCSNKMNCFWSSFICEHSSLEEVLLKLMEGTDKKFSMQGFGG